MSIHDSFIDVKFNNNFTCDKIKLYDGCDIPVKMLLGHGRWSWSWSTQMVFMKLSSNAPSVGADQKERLILMISMLLSKMVRERFLKSQTQCLKTTSISPNRHLCYCKKVKWDKMILFSAFLWFCIVNIIRHE